jgi:hypothetical protein
MQGGGKGGSAVFGTPFEAGSGKKTLSVSLVKVSICTLGQVSPACDTCRLLLPVRIPVRCILSLSPRRRTTQCAKYLALSKAPPPPPSLAAILLREP